MKLYIATPINARQEPTIREKLLAAKHRIAMLKEVIADDVQFKDYELVSTFDFNNEINEEKANAHFASICIDLHSDNEYDYEYDNELSSPDVEDNKKEPPSTTTTKEKNFVEEMKNKSPIWKETVGIKYQISDKELSSWLDKLTVHCRSRDVVHTSLKDAKRHFDDWLRINLAEKNGKKNTAAARKANNNLEMSPSAFKFEKF